MRTMRQKVMLKPTEYPEDTSDFSGSAYDIIQAGITTVQRR